MNARADRFPLFDSLRAIAALSVLATHAAYFAGLQGGGLAIGPYAARLDVGVHIFFLISAFLLYRPFVRARLRGEPGPTTGAYAWRRFLRIAPAYWMALTVTTLWLGGGGGVIGFRSTDVFSLEGIPSYFGFAQVYRAETVTGGIPQAWSLCVEVAFYAFLPLWAALMGVRAPAGPGRRLRRELWGAAALVTVAIAYKVGAVSLGAVSDPDRYPLQFLLPAFLDDFGLGMAVAALSAWYEGRERRPAPLRAIERFPGLPWIWAAVAFWAVSTQIGLTGRLDEPMTGPQYLERHALYAAVAVGILLPAVFGEPGRGLVRRLLAARPLLWLGLISYGIYLYHFNWIVQLDRWGLADALQGSSAYLWFPIALGGAVAMAAASYYVLERPLLRLKRLVGPARERQPEEAVAEPAPLGPPRPTRAG